MKTKTDNYVVVRCTAAGCHAGYLQSYSGQTVVLHQSRRLWYWRVPMGSDSFLCGVAANGLDHDASKVGIAIEETVLLDACEILSCTEVGRDSILAAPTVKRVR